MTATVASYIDRYQSRFNRLLDDLPALRLENGSEPSAPKRYREASRYCLINSGKRVRPLLVYTAANTIGGAPPEAGLDRAALAVELIHTYSLVHDDLPAMDDDDLRRGKPSLHRAYGEAAAILVGDGLQASAFQLIAESPGFDAGQKVAMVAALARAAGSAGMVGGQFIDIDATNSEMALEDLAAMHAMKTGALIRASLALGGIAARGDDEQLAALDSYGRHIGLAFQVVDDILDVRGETARLGKTRGKDGKANKPTYVKLMGVEGAQAEAERLLHMALDSLACFESSADYLRALARYIVERDR